MVLQIAGKSYYCLEIFKRSNLFHFSQPVKFLAIFYAALSALGGLVLLFQDKRTLEKAKTPSSIFKIIDYS